jgi:hypothetical protein
VTVIAEVLADASSKMSKALEVAREDFSTVRTGRINPQLFQKIQVGYYGTPTPLDQLASLQVSDARTLVVSPYDKSALRDIEQAIREVPNLGANPSNDGTIIRVTLPRSFCETSGARPWMTWTPSRARSARTTSSAAARSSRRSPSRMSTLSMTRSSARKPSCSRFNPEGRHER